MVTAVAYRLAEHSRQIAEILSEFRLTREQLLEVRRERERERDTVIVIMSVSVLLLLCVTSVVHVA